MSMDKVGMPSCCLRHGAPSQSSKPPHTLRRSTMPLTPAGNGRLFAGVVDRCALTHAGAATSDADVATVRHTTANDRSFDLEGYLSAKVDAVNDALVRAMPSGRPERLCESMRYSVLAGGKRVHPVLAIAACELVGGPSALATPVACAVEMLHTVSLIRDDMPCMDDDGLRRGRPSNHVAFGESTALLASIALHSLAFKHLARGCAELGVSAWRTLRAFTELANAAGDGGVAAGQVIDKESVGALVNLAMPMLEHIHLHKTARLLEASAVSGAFVGGATDAEVESVRRYARCVGLLFQVVDDVLDVTRTSEQLGKTAGKDLAADKATYPKLLGVDQARAYAGELLAKAEAELEGFDADRAAPLRHLARFIAYRQN